MRYFALTLILLTLTACGGAYATVAEEVVVESPNPISTPTPSPISTPSPSPDIQPINQRPERSVYITITDTNLHEEPSGDSASRGIVADGAWVRLLNYYSDDWYFVDVPDNYPYFFGYIAAKFLAPLAKPEPWPLPAVEISDFGRQMAEEFLSQFDSLFLPFGWRDTKDGNAYYWGMGGRTSVGEGLHFSSWAGQCQEGWRTIYFDQFGNEIVEEVPFIKHNMIALGFALYDLNYDGIPEIVITFSADSVWVSYLYIFVDGQYVMVSTSTSLWAGSYHFFYDQDGRVGVIATGEGGYMSAFYHIDFGSDVMNLTHVFQPSMFFDWELYGLTRIPPLTGLQDAIRESITERLFQY